MCLVIPASLFYNFGSRISFAVSAKDLYVFLCVIIVSI